MQAARFGLFGVFRRFLSFLMCLFGGYEGFWFWRALISSNVYEVLKCSTNPKPPNPKP